jgi:hypothetical protein
MKAVRVVSRIVSGLYILSFVCLVLITGALRVTAADNPPRAQMFDNITVIGSPLVLSTPAEVDAAEAHLGIRFPTGYREYVTTFGEGVLGGSYIRIYPPHRILGGTSNNLLQWRQRISECWFWDRGSALSELLRTRWRCCRSWNVSCGFCAQQGLAKLGCSRASRRIGTGPAGSVANPA